jgi:hypothetical protein
MVKWNDIPYNEDADPEVKALEFDLQIEENTQAVKHVCMAFCACHLGQQD